MWDVNGLLEYWSDYPPTHILVSAYLMGGKRSSNRKKANRNELDELVQAVSAAGGTLNHKLPQLYRA